jgi:hypothetical protein
VDRRLSVTLVVLAAGSAVATGMVFYTLRRTPMPIPVDPDHRSSRVALDCLVCHAPGAGRPRGKNHPLNDQCFNCHERG